MIPVREGWMLVNTCSACPEQYELIDHKGEKKAYLRLRWGYFYVTCPWVNDEVVFEHTFEDDGYKGCFDGPDEREKFLRAAVDAAETWWRSAERAEP